MKASIFSKYLPLQLSFLVFSMLLNCMGIIILKYSGTQISYRGLGFLEFFKDIPIAIMSMVAVSFINKKGTKKSLITALTAVLLCCLLLPCLEGFWFFRLWFVVIGVSFAIAKIAIFAIIRNNSSDEKCLTIVMNRVEASFVIGVFCVNMGFGWLLSSMYSEFWKYGFWIIGLISLCTILLLRKQNYMEIPAEKIHILHSARQIFSLRNSIFFLIIFFLVFMEQGFNSWLPTFYRNNLKVNSFYSLQSTAFLALFSFLGRYLTSRLIVHFQWKKYLFFCLAALLFIMMAAQLLMADVSRYLNLLMIIFPLLGLFLSPLYPLYNSKFLATTGKEKVNFFVSVIVVFSSLGSSFGSLAMSYIFHYSADTYFIIFSLLPLIMIILLTLFFTKLTSITS